MKILRPDFLPVERLSSFEATFSFEYTELEKKLEYAIMTYGVKEKRKGRDILNIPITFDIETTTLPEGHKYNPKDELVAFPYLYQMYFFGAIFFCRERTQIYLLFNTIEQLCIKHDVKLVCYVHNLSFEYQFMKSILDIDYEKVFLVKNRKIAKFELKTDTIVFRDSYLLSNMSLAKFCENYNEPAYWKDKELIDYEVARYPWSKLSNEVLYYSGMDVICLYQAVISLMKRENDDICSIPMTNTGYVRRAYKKACLGNANHRGFDKKSAKAENEKKKSYRERYMKKQQITLEQYNLLLKAFRGGNTHASRFKAERILKNVTSYDFASSYPAVMICSDEFPIGKIIDCTSSIKSNPSMLNRLVKDYWVLIDAVFEDVKLRDNLATPVPYIPKAKVITDSFDGVYDNGRIISQKSPFEFAFLGCEYPIIQKQYSGKMRIIRCFYAKKGYLPDEIRNECYSWYKKKTELKNVEGMEYEYMKSKNRVNSSYGMMVEKIVKDVQEVQEDGSVKLRKPTEEEATEQLKSFYDIRQNKFLQYQWGVTVTAVARVRLQELIDLAAKDFVYADTDSVKIENGEAYKEKIEEYNRAWIQYAEKAGVPFRAYTVKGEEQILGYADFDAFYDRFITLGAKKYAYENNHGLSITIAGVPKKLGAKLLGCLENFKTGMVFMIGADGSLEDRQSWKKRLYYNDNANYDLSIDGHSLHIGTYIAMERTPYELSITEEYEELLDLSMNEYFIEKDDIFD